MTHLDRLLPQFDVLTRLANDHLWVTTDELCEVLRLEPRSLYDARGKLTPQFDWRNFHIRQVKYAGNGQHFWEVLNRARALAQEAMTAPRAAAPADDAAPIEVVVQKHAFMPADFHDGLLAHALAHEADFYPATTHSAANDYRHSLAYDDLGDFDEIFQRRLAGVFESVAFTLGVPLFQVVAFERQILAYPDGCYFKHHTDANELNPARRISFCYYFHRQPRAFTGGELLLFADEAGPDGQFPTVAEIQPQDNTIVFFDSRQRHEVLPVRMPSGNFADSRFAITGWLHGPGKRV